MKRSLIVFVSLLVLISTVTPVSASTSVQCVYWPACSYPYFFIDAVTQDQTVTIHAYNFPANDTFIVTMGYYGTYGIGGVQVTTTKTGIGGSFVTTYSIPEALWGQYRIAIRLSSPTTGYYAYNWFYNNTYPVVQPPVNPPQPGYIGYPYFFIKSVVRDESVTIQAYNFPTNDNFIVTMGAYGTLGIGGYVVATTTTGSTPGGFEVTYPIPASLDGSYRIAIRLQSPSTGYFAYNWFYNNTTTP